MQSKNNDRKPLGEVIATSYSSFTVENYQLESTPPLGALVVAQSVLGVVCSAKTEGLGPISARGTLDDEDGSVYELYPDLQRTLRSEFNALVVGCYQLRNVDSALQDSGAGEEQSAIRDSHSAIVYTYPECPPQVHYKCWLAPDAELVAFTERPDYLRLLIASTEATNIDQVLIHLIVRGYKARGKDRDWLFATAEYLGRQLKGQYDRLLAILKTLDGMTAEQRAGRSEISGAVGSVRL